MARNSITSCNLAYTAYYDEGIKNVQNTAAYRISIKNLVQWHRDRGKEVSQEALSKNSDGKKFQELQFLVVSWKLEVGSSKIPWVKISFRLGNSQMNLYFVQQSWQVYLGNCIAHFHWFICVKQLAMNVSRLMQNASVKPSSCSNGATDSYNWKRFTPKVATKA